MHALFAHPVVWTLIGYYLLNAVTAGMPTPDANSGLAYRWAHGSLNALALNITELARARYPQLLQPKS